MDQVAAQALTVFAGMVGVNRDEALEMKHEPRLTTMTFPMKVSRGNGSVERPRRKVVAST